MQIRSILLVALFVAFASAEIVPSWPPTQPVLVANGLGFRSGSVLPCDKDYWRIESFDDVSVSDYLVVDFNQTGESRAPSDRGALYIKRSSFPDLRSALETNGFIQDTLGELPGPTNFDWVCEDERCIFEIDCKFTDGTYYLAVAGGKEAIIQYNFTVARRTLNVTALQDRQPIAFFNDSTRRVLNELNYGNPPSPSFPDRAHHYRFYEFDVPESRFSEGTYFIVNISRAEPFPFGTMRLHYGKLPLAAFDTELLDHADADSVGSDPASCAYDHCVDTSLAIPNEGDLARPFFDRPVISMPRVPCVCTPDIQRFEDLTFQLTCNITVDPCHFQYGKWYISLELPEPVELFNTTVDLAAQANYTLAAVVVQPTVTSLFRNVTFKGFVEPERVTHYKLEIPDTNFNEGANHLLVHISNIRGGTIDINVHRGLGVGQNLAGGREGCVPANATCRSYDACNLVIEKCHLIPGTYYISLEVAYVTTGPGDNGFFLIDDVDRLPLTFTIRANWMEDSEPHRLLAGVPVHRFIGEALYDFYVVDVPATIDTWMYVELFAQAKDTEVILAMLHGSLPGGECYDRPDFYCMTGDARALEIPTGNPRNLIDRPLAREACSFMIQTCELEAGPLYLSVYGHHVGYNPYGDNTFYQIPVQYTLWVDFDVALAVQSSVSYSEHVFENQYQHYYIRADNVNEGSSMSVEVTNIQHGIPQSLEVFVNYNFLAGNCPCYDHLFNCTGNPVSACGLEEEENFLPSPEVVDTCCTIVVPPCDFRSGVWYIAVLGVNEDVVQYTTPIGYTLTATIIPAPPVEPLILGQVEADHVTQWNITNEYKHYKLAAQPLPLNDLVIKIAYVQNCEYKAKHDNLRDTLTVYVNSGALASSECHRYKCEANIQSESYCTVVVPHCEWDADDWFVSVQGNFDAVFPGRYSLRANVEEVRDTRLTSGVTAYGRVSWGRFQHYFLDVQNDETRFLVIELYTNADQDTVSAYLNIDQRAGVEPCLDYWRPYICADQSSCSWKLEGCDIRFGRYYVSVHGTAHQFYDISVEYALTATLQRATVPLGEGDPLTGHVVLGHANHYTFTVATVEEGQFLLFEVENVKHGVVVAYINFGSLAGRCAHCTNYAHTDSCVADSDNSESGDKNWCELRVAPCLMQSGDYYFSVVGVEEKTPSGSPLLLATAIGYTLEVNLVDGTELAPVVETVRSTANRLTAQFIANGRYRHYRFETTTEDWDLGRHVIVEITRIREGALFAYYNDGFPGDEAPDCHRARICSTEDMSVDGTCLWQMPFCLTDPGVHFISIEGITGRLQASFSILIYKQDAASVIANPSFVGLTSERSNNINAANELNITHAHDHSPNGWVQFVQLPDVTVNDREGDLLELFFYRIQNNPGASTDFEVYLYPGEPAGRGDCCEGAPGSCQTFPCLRHVRQFTQVLDESGDTTTNANPFLCSGGTNSTEPGFEGFRCNVTVAACDLDANHVGTIQTWWATIVPVASPAIADSFNEPGLTYSLQWRVRNSRRNAEGVEAASTSLTNAVNGDYTQFYEMDVFEDYRAFHFDVEVPVNVHKRVIVQTDFDDGTTSDDVVVYVNKDNHAGAYCNDFYFCTGADCNCDGRYVSPSCCVGTGSYHITVRNKRDNPDAPVRFRFAISVLTEGAIQQITSASASAPFVASDEIFGENYHHYEINVGSSDISRHSSLVAILRKTDDDADSLELFARSGRVAGDYRYSLDHDIHFQQFAENCHSYQYTCVASGSADDSDQFDTDGRCVLQIPYCQLEQRAFFLSVRHPNFFEVGTCDRAADGRDYELIVYWDDEPTQLVLGQALVVPDTAPVGLRDNNDLLPTFVHYQFDVSAADLAYDPRDVLSGYYTRFLRVELGEFTVGSGDLYLNYDDNAGHAWDCLNSFASQTGCETEDCVIDVFPCDGTDDDDNVDDGDTFYDNGFKLVTGRYYAGVRIPVLAAFSVRATVLTNVYEQVTGFVESGDGHRTGTENRVYTVQPDRVERFNRTEFRYVIDTQREIDGTEFSDDDDDISGRDYFIANLTVISSDLSPSVSLNVWRDDCSRFACTVNSVNGSCVIDAQSLATCSSKGGRYYFRVDSPIALNSDRAIGFRLDFYHNESTVQAIRDKQVITEIIFPHEYEEYFYPVSDVGSVRTLAVTIQSVCGDLEAWIKPSGRAGPTPAVSKSDGPCSVDYCRTFGGDDERELDLSEATCTLFLDTCNVESEGYWIGVRGVATEFPSSVNENLLLPIKYHISVDERVIDTTTTLAPTWPHAYSYDTDDSGAVVPQQLVFDFETHNVGAMLRFSMRLPTHLVGVVSPATLTVSRNRAVGYTAGCSNHGSCTINVGETSCSWVMDECAVDELHAAKIYFLVDAPIGTEVLVERWDPIIPIADRLRPYASAVAAPDSTNWQLPWSVPRQYYRFDASPSKLDFFLRVRIYDVEHGAVSLTVNSAGNTADGGNWFGPANDCGVTPLVWNDECSFVEDGEWCVANVHRCQVVDPLALLPFPRTFFITVHGEEQLCELHEIKYKLQIEEFQEFERLAINDGPACAAVHEDEYNHYRLSPHAIEDEQQTILTIKIADVDVSNPEEVLLAVNDGALATDVCNTASLRSDVFVGSGEIEYICGYDELFLSVLGLRSGADEVNPTLINYNIEVVKSLVEVIELEDDIGFIIADEQGDFSDDDDQCSHHRDFFQYTATSSNDAESYLEVIVESDGEVEVFLNKDSFAWTGCNIEHCHSDLSNEASGCVLHDYCGFRSGSYYITVVADQDYTILVRTVHEVTTMSVGSTQRGRVEARDTVFYALPISSSAFNPDSRLVIDVTEVYYGDVEVSIAFGKLPSAGDDDDNDCNLDHAVVETYTPTFEDEALKAYNRLVIDHSQLQAGTYYIAVDGKNRDQLCHSIRFALHASINSLGIVPEPLTLGLPAQPSPQFVDRTDVDIAESLHDPVYRYYVVNPENTGSSAFGQIRLANVRDGALRLRVKKGHLATSDHAFFDGTRHGLVSYGNDFESLQTQQPAQAGSRPNTWQRIMDDDDGQVIPGSWDWWCDAEYVDGVEEEHQTNRGCNIVIRSCDWSDAPYYIVVEARRQDYQDSPISFDLIADDYVDFRLLAPDTPQSERFTDDNNESHFYAAQQSEEESVRIRTQVTSGEAVTVTVSDSRCPELQTWSRSQWCHADFNNDAYLCDIEIPTRAAHPGRTVRTFYITVTGKNATYSIAYWRQRQNCHEFKGDGSQDGLDFCAGLVPYTVWRWNHYETLDREAHGTFLQLYDHFRVQPCWSGVTRECNQTLQRFACYESFKRCDKDGFIVGTCRKACQAVTYECVNNFESVNLEAWRCDNDRYLDETTEACTGHREEEPLSNNVFLNDVNVILFETRSGAATLAPALIGAVSALILLLLL